MRWAIVAHPDDEVIFAGGALLTHRDEPWTVVIATHPDDSPRAVEAIAARDALRALGVQVDYRFLGHDDAQFHPTGGIDVAVLADQLASLGVRPGDRVYTHGEPGEYGHRGHQAVHLAVAEILGRLAEVSVFAGDGPVIETIEDAVLMAQKRRLFDTAYPSQARVWTSIASLMQDVMRVERHLDLAPAAKPASLAETAVPARAAVAAGMKLFQYWDASQPPDDVARWIEGVRSMNPELAHRLYDREAAARFIAEHFGERETQAFDACAVPAMQADYFRLCALIAEGGMYLDADSRSVAPLSSLLGAYPKDLMVTFRDSMTSGCMVFRRPANAFLRAWLEIATANIEERHFGTVVLATGPAIADALRAMLDKTWFRAMAAKERDKWMRTMRFGAPLDRARALVTRTPELKAAFRNITLLDMPEALRWIGIAKPAYKQGPQHWPNWKGSIYADEGVS